MTDNSTQPPGEITSLVSGKRKQPPSFKADLIFEKQEDQALRIMTGEVEQAGIVLTTANMVE